MQINCNTQYDHRKAKSNQQTTVRSVHVCAMHCAQLLHTILHRTDLIIFPLILQTIIIAQDDVYWKAGLTRQQAALLICLSSAIEGTAYRKPCAFP